MGLKEIKMGKIKRNQQFSNSNNLYKLKMVRYPESNFTIVKNQPVQYLKWDLEKCLDRKEKETKKILDYIFN